MVTTESVKAGIQAGLACEHLEVAGDGQSVVHRVEGSLNPAWVGGNQVRTLRFDGDRLVLHANVEKAGAIVRHELTWERC